MLKEEIEKLLIEAGISIKDIIWRTDTQFRYRSCKELPNEAYNAIAFYMVEDLYEDDDGDDDRGRPIIRRLYTYHFKNN